MSDVKKRKRALEGAFTLWLLEQGKQNCTKEEKQTLRELFDAMDYEDKEIEC